ncbi:hypothetical protein F5148DRAFT_1194849 [Russula earlei]|uniref:Uncharacterized protein n=1 Tax=Russula earlei TaxID=71964 RepID=A0ACC0UAX5_9AGAM|nr:hypothetical protein F5148DRAFT_1194849 [Russula earlei]
MVHLSLLSRDKNTSQFQAGSSFTPTFSGRFKSPLSLPPSVLRRFKSIHSAPQSQPVDHPLMTLRLSSPSFLDSVVHDGSSDNPLYVIDTDHNVTKIRRSDPKGFVNVSCVRWPRHALNSTSRNDKDLTGVEVMFGKGQWKPADDFLGYSYSSLSSYRKFYIPHHPHSLKWKPFGFHHVCTTETVKGPVAILEPASQRAPPQLKIFDPLFRFGSSRPQRMHNGLPLSLLDFLLVTAMMLVTPNDEWMNVTRINPSEPLPDSWHPSDGSSSEHPDLKPLLPASATPPVIERWRSSILAQVMEDNESHRGESDDGRSKSSRATSRLSFHTDIQSMAQHPTYPPGQGIFSTHSGSSLSLSSHNLSYSQHGHRKTRHLPVPPIQPSFGRDLPSTSYPSHVPFVSHVQPSQDPPLSTTPLLNPSSTSPFDLRSPHMIPAPISSRPVVESPSTSIHTRSLPIPPTSSTSKSQFPMLPPVSAPNSNTVITPVSSLPGPVPSLAHGFPLLHSRSYAHLRGAASYPDSPSDYKSLVEAPPDNTDTALSATASPISDHSSDQREVMSRLLSIRTTDVPTVFSVGSASAASGNTSSTSEADPFDLPPAYSSLDVANASLRLRAINGGVGG